MSVCVGCAHVCVLNLVHICNISLYTRQKSCKCSTVSTLPIIYPMTTPKGQIISIHYDTCLLLIRYHLDVTCQSMSALLRDPLTTDEQKHPLPEGTILKVIGDYSKQGRYLPQCRSERMPGSNWEKHPHLNDKESNFLF